LSSAEAEPVPPEHPTIDNANTPVNIVAIIDFLLLNTSPLNLNLNFL